MSTVRIRRAVVAAMLAVLATFVPVRIAWSDPAVRLEELPATPGRRVALPWPSSHLGVRWQGSHDDTGGPTDTVALRWSDGTEWSPGQPVDIDQDLGDHEQGRFLSPLVPVEKATAVELRVDSGTPQDLAVVAIDTTNGPRRLVMEKPPPAPAAAAVAAGRVPQPEVISRSQWGADESLRGPVAPPFAPVTRLAVHHTASPEGSDPRASVRAVYAYHTRSNGWSDIGYNFVIDSAGRVYEGRYARPYAAGETPTGETVDGRGVVGAHIGGNNTGTVGVALLGEFTSVQPSVAALDALQRLLTWEADRHEIDALGTIQWTTGERPTIIGHRDVGATACPGTLLYDKLPAIRQAIATTVSIVRAERPPTGYWLLGRDGGLFTFGGAGFFGGPGEVPLPVMSMAGTRTGKGYWLLSASGRISAFGDAVGYGSTEGMRLNAAAVRLEPTPTGLGYWVQAADGGIFSFGDAAFHGSTGSLRLNAPVISMAATPTGLGYWLLAADGGVFTFGDAAFHGSTASLRLNAPVVSMAPTTSGLGYWLMAGDGGIFSFGAVCFLGSVPGLHLAGTAPSVQIRATTSGLGYYVLASDGGVFTFGDALFDGARPGLRGPSMAVDLALQRSDVQPVRPAPTVGLVPPPTSLGPPPEDASPKA